MGQTYNSPSPESSSQVLQNYSQYLPGLVQSTGATLPGLAQNQLNATMATQPLYNALNLQQLQQYGLPNAQVGQQIANSNALAGAQTNLSQIQGAGGQAANAAANLNNTLNPVQATNNAQAQNLVNSINLNGLSGGEEAAVERSLNQSNYATGNLGIDNATNAVSNAMNFGNALQAKRAALGNALGTATGVAAAQNSQFNPINIALGQPNTSTASNFGTGTFSPTSAATQNTGTNTAFGFGSGALSNMSSMNNAATSGAYGLAGANSIPAYMGSIPSYS